jgi:hypothetical protein
MRNAALGRRPALGLSNLPRDKTGQRPPQVARIGPITWLNQEAQTLFILYADETGGDQVPGQAFGSARRLGLSAISGPNAQSDVLQAERRRFGLSTAAALPTVLSKQITNRGR